MAPNEPLAALRLLHAAVIRHGCTEGDGPAWLAAWTSLMAAVQRAGTVIAAADGANVGTETHVAE